MGLLSRMKKAVIHHRIHHRIHHGTMRKQRQEGAGGAHRHPPIFFPLLNFWGKSQLRPPPMLMMNRGDNNHLHRLHFSPPPQPQQTLAAPRQQLTSSFLGWLLGYPSLM